MSTTAEPRLKVRDVLGERTVPIAKATFTIGRRSENDLSLTGGDISKVHAEIAEANGRYLVRDKGSRYGTFVNGKPATEQTLNHGGRMTMGRGGGAVRVRPLTGAAVDSHSGSSIGGDLRQISMLLETLRNM